MEPEKNSLTWEERLERLKAQREMEGGNMRITPREVFVTPVVPVVAKMATPKVTPNLNTPKVVPVPTPQVSPSLITVPVKTIPQVSPPPKATPINTSQSSPPPKTTASPIIPQVVPSPRAIPGPVGVSLNTHDYDGKLVEQVTGSMAPIMKDEFYDSMGKLRRIMELYQTLEQGSGGWAHYFDLIVADHQRAPQNNFDPSNGVDAAQVLYNIHLKIQTLLSLTQLQLEDMASGPCPQGRATRLLSVFLST